MNGAAADKAELRRQARRRLARIPPAAREAAGVAVAHLASEAPEIARPGTLLCFASLPDEVPTARIAAAARAGGATLAYPRVVGERLILHRVESPTELEPGRWGIPEPAATAPAVEPEQVDAVLVPGFAWDRCGRRLGRGGGFYDRLLASIPAAFRCGVLFAELEVEAVPVDAWDLPLDAVLTPREVWRRRPGNGRLPSASPTSPPPRPRFRTSSR